MLVTGSHQARLRQGFQDLRDKLHCLQARPLLSQSSILQNDWQGRRTRYGKLSAFRSLAVTTDLVQSLQWSNSTPFHCFSHQCYLNYLFTICEQQIGLYYKCFTLLIYDCNGNCLYYKTTILFNLAIARSINYDHMVMLQIVAYFSSTHHCSLQ